MQDAFVSDLAAGVLQQQGENYFQRGQAFVQSKMGFLSSSNLQYHFNIDNTYGASLFLTPLPSRRMNTIGKGDKILFRFLYVFDKHLQHIWNSSIIGQRLTPQSSLAILGTAKRHSIDFHEAQYRVAAAMRYCSNVSNRRPHCHCMNTLSDEKAAK